MYFTYDYENKVNKPKIFCMKKQFIQLSNTVHILAKMSQTGQEL